MDSSFVGRAGGIVVYLDPFFWVIPAALAVGSGLALFTRSLFVGRRGERKRGARLSAWGISLFALGLLFAVGFFVFPPKTSLSSRYVLETGIVSLLLGLGTGSAPRAFGLPFLGLVLAGGLFLGQALDGWLPLRGPGAIGRIVPFSVEAGSFKGELEVDERDTVPTIQKIELPLGEVALVVERLELSGPLGLFSGRSFYRVAGIAGAPPNEEERSELIASFELRSPLLDRVLPLAEGRDASSALPFVLRRRETSNLVPLMALAPLRYAFSEDPEGTLRLRVDPPDFLGK